MGQLVNDLGNKAEGMLIKSADWNDLVAAVEAVEDRLTTRIQDLGDSVDTRFEQTTKQITDLDSRLEDGLRRTETQIKDLSDRVDQLEGRLTSLSQVVESVLGQYYRVTMESSKLSYAMGELAQITARVTDLQGNPLDLQDPDQRPWIDFVTAWGLLKPASGFQGQSRGGAGDRAISVRTNADGAAQVLLKSESVEGLGEEIEEDVAATLTTALPSTQVSIANTILQTATPMEARASGAFQVLSDEYDRPDTTSFRTYVDNFYALNAPQITGRLFPRPTHRWREFRSTVLAFAKSDDDPRTPDQGRGVSSIHVTFRDWIGPWIVLDYLPNIDRKVADIRTQLGTRVTRDYRESVDLITENVRDIVRNKGLLGKQREYVAVRNALDGLAPSQGPAPSFLPTLTRAVQDAIVVQQTQDYIRAATIGGPEEETTFEVLTEAVVRADTGLEAVRAEVGQVAQSISSFNTDVTQLKTSVSSLGGRLDASLAEGGELQQVRASLDTVTRQVAAFQAIDESRLQEFRGLGSRIINLERQTFGIR